MFLVGAALDAQRVIGVTGEHLGLVVALRHVHARIILFDPRVDVLDIKGDHLAQTRDLVNQRLDGADEQIGEELPVETSQLLTQPEARGHGGSTSKP